MSGPRLYVGSPADWTGGGVAAAGGETPGAGPGLASGQRLTLPPTAARHVQVLRLQPGDPLILFDGHGGQWRAEVREMGRQSVMVEVGTHEAVERELPVAVTLAVCMPANDRMDDLVEKATELGAVAIRPLMSRRSVLRLQGERAARKQAHWQAVAAAACEQCGRNRVPAVHAVQDLGAFLAGLAGPTANGPTRWQLSLREPSVSMTHALQNVSLNAGAHFIILSGPEGGWDPEEETLAARAGFQAITLGPRTLRADTAPLAVMAALGVWSQG